jgi:hypothetical protein
MSQSTGGELDDVAVGRHAASSTRIPSVPRLRLDGLAVRSQNGIGMGACTVS